MLSLPKDILIFIFCKVENIKNIENTCKNFKTIVNSDRFWINKIINTYPALQYAIPEIAKNDYRKYYYELENIFKENKNYQYLSALAQSEKRIDILKILDYKHIVHAKFCKSYYEEGMIQCEYYIDPYNSDLIGKYIFFYKNGSINEIVFYKRSLCHGYRIVNDENGKLKEFGLYINGKKEEMFYYYKNGELEIECFYKNDILDGVLNTYIDGKKFEHYNFSNGNYHGIYKQYHSNTVIKEEGQFFYGKKSGKWCYYNGKGKLKNMLFFEN